MNTQLNTGLLPKVMIVDDDDNIRATVSALLAAEGVAALTASGSSECLARLRSGFRGVILMDVMMPGTNGWDAIREIIKENMLDGNIITMLTAMDAPDEQMDGLQEHVIDYLTKPFEPDSFLKSVRRYLQLLEQIPSNR